MVKIKQNELYLFNHVRAKLLFRQVADLATEFEDNGLREVGLSKVKNVLNHVIAESVLDKVKRVFGDFCDQLDLLFPRSVVDTSLKDTTSMAMSSDWNAMFSNGIENELVASQPPNRWPYEKI